MTGCTIDFRELSLSVGNIINVTKGVPGSVYILLDFFHDSKLLLGYSDGRITYSEKLDIKQNQEESSNEIKIAIDVRLLQTKLALFNGKDTQIDEVDLNIDEKNTLLVISGRKYIKTSEEKAEETGAEPLITFGSKISTSVPYLSLEKSTKFNKSTQVDYDQHFLGEYTDNTDAMLFKNLVNKAIATDGATAVMFVNSTEQIVVVGTGFTTILPFGLSSNLCLAISHLKILVSLLGGITKEDRLWMNIQPNQVTFKLSDRAIIVLEQTTVKRYIATQAAILESRNYDTQFIEFSKPMIKDILNSLLTTRVKEAVSDLLFDVDVENNTIQLKAVSKYEQFYVKALDYEAINGDINNYSNKRITVSLKNLLNILKNCDGKTVRFNFSNELPDDPILRDRMIKQNTKPGDYLRVDDIESDMNSDNYGDVNGNYYLCI